MGKRPDHLLSTKNIFLNFYHIFFFIFFLEFLLNSTSAKNCVRFSPPTFFYLITICCKKRVELFSFQSLSHQNFSTFKKLLYCMEQCNRLLLDRKSVKKNRIFFCNSSYSSIVKYKQC